MPVEHSLEEGDFLPDTPPLTMKGGGGVVAVRTESRDAVVN